MAAKSIATTFIKLLWSRVAADHGPYRADNLRTFHKLAQYQNIRTPTDKATPSGDALSTSMMLLASLSQQRDDLLARKAELITIIAQWQPTVQFFVNTFGESHTVLDSYMRYISTDDLSEELATVRTRIDQVLAEINRGSESIRNILSERHDLWVTRMVGFSERFTSYLMTANPKVDAVVDTMDYNF